PRSSRVKFRNSRQPSGSLGRHGLPAPAACRQFGFVIADIGQQQWVLPRHRARLLDELDELLDAERFLIGGPRATGGRETVRRGGGLERSQGLGTGSRQGAENDRGGDRKSGEEAGAERGHGGFLIVIRHTAHMYWSRRRSGRFIKVNK